MIDYNFKSAVLKFDESTSLLKIYSQYSMYEYDKRIFNTLPYGCCEDYITNVADYYKTNYPDYWEEARKINNAHYERTRRLRTKLHWLLTNFDCCFLTFNFSDSTLQLESSYRRKLITSTCNSLETYYIGNIDFGNEELYYDRHGVQRLGTSREHYHVVVACNVDTRTTAPLKAFISSYGYVYVEHCYMPNNDTKLLSRYVSKLSNHAVKETACRSSLLYSRKHKIPELPLIKDSKITPSMIKKYRPTIDELQKVDDDTQIYLQEDFLDELLY